MLIIRSSSCREVSFPSGALCRQIISGHSLFPLMRLLPFAALSPRSMGRGQCAEPTRSLQAGSACSSPPEMVWAAPITALGRGTVSMTSGPGESKQSRKAAAPEASLPREWKKEAGSPAVM